MTIENTPSAAPAVEPIAVPDAAAASAAPSVTEIPLIAEVVQPTAAPTEAAPDPEAKEAAPEVAEADAKKPFAHTDEPTILESAGKEEKKADAAKETEVKGDTPKPEETKPEGDNPVEVARQPDGTLAEPLKYAEFKFPEDVKVDAEKIGAYTGIIGKYGVPQDVAQQLMDMHVDTLKTYAANLAEQQHMAFANTRKEWRTQIAADEEIGGAGSKTALMNAASARDSLLFDADPKVRVENHRKFNDMLRLTGAGDHPEFVRAFARAGQRFGEPAVPAIQGKPTANHGKAPNARKMGVLYDAPSSSHNRS